MTDKPIVVVLTALNVEYSAVLRHLHDIEKRVHKTGTRFEIGSVEGSTCRIALGLTGAGNAPAAVLAERVIQEFAPVAVLFVGVAGALRDSAALGDVVVASRVYAYQGGTSEDDGLKGRPRTWEAPHGVFQLAQELDRTGTWTKRLPLTPDPPKVHFGPIATGEIVQNSKSSPEAQWLREHYNDAAAIEMEAGGVAQAGHLNGVAFAIVRGISDRADGDKTSANDGTWQPLAADHAAAFAIELATQLISETAPVATPINETAENPVTPIETLAIEGGKELVKALAAGLVASLRKVPTLWRRKGSADEQRIHDELHRSAAELAAFGEDAGTRARVEDAWRTELHQLLKEHPEAQKELRQILSELRQSIQSDPPIRQSIISSGQGSVAQGVIGGSIHNYGKHARGADGNAANDSASFGSATDDGRQR